MSTYTDEKKKTVRKKRVVKNSIMQSSHNVDEKFSMSIEDPTNAIS